MKSSVSPTQIRLGVALGHVCHSASIPQSVFARTEGATEKHVCLVFSGKSSASLDTLERWAMVLGCRIDVTLVAAGGAAGGVTGDET